VPTSEEEEETVLTVFSSESEHQVSKGAVECSESPLLGTPSDPYRRVWFLRCFCKCISFYYLYSYNVQKIKYYSVKPTTLIPYFLNKTVVFVFVVLVLVLVPGNWVQILFYGWCKLKYT
jgi:hypothetical protein